ncbi:hypothetical protein [Sphingomonas adhaesiva]|uniref:hypothetical protein n=1 Tax=Sphingomonas adhaesiva TaxID=28212 RepID=UPI002FF4B9B0
MRSRFLLWPLGGLILAATPVVAQQTTPVPAATTVPSEASAVPPPISIAPPVPQASPSPVVTLPAATPTPRATPRPRVTPTPQVTPTPRATATARATASPTPTPTSVASAAPLPATTPSVIATVPVAVPTPPPPAPAAVEEGASHGWLFPGAVVLVLAVLAGVLLARRRRRDDTAEVAELPAAVEAVPVPPLPAIAEAHVVAPRAWLAFELRPRRAGVNLLTATLDAQLVVRNEGDAAANDVRAEVRLLSAREGQEGELAGIFADAGGRPVAAPFALAPGEERGLDVLVTLPRDAINVLTAGGRPMFVPVAAVNVRYASGEVRGQTAEAFAVGVERDGAAKLMPFWLDGPGRMFDTVAARPHALAVRS